MNRRVSSIVMAANTWWRTDEDHICDSQIPKGHLELSARQHNVAAFGMVIVCQMRWTSSVKTIYRVLVEVSRVGMYWNLHKASMHVDDCFVGFNTVLASSGVGIKFWTTKEIFMTQVVSLASSGSCGGEAESRGVGLQCRPTNM